MANFQYCAIYSVMKTILIFQFLSGYSIFAASLSNDVQKYDKNDDPDAVLYMSEHCRAMIWNYLIDSNYMFLDTQATLMAHPLKDIQQSRMYVRQQTCLATFAAPPGHQLLLHFMDIAIDYRSMYESRLYVFDGFNADVRISPPHGLYGESNAVPASETFPTSNIVMMDYTSSSQAMTLMFKGFLSKRFYGFKAILTPYKKPNKNNTCPAGLFQCTVNKYCISQDLTCNGKPNCGERDDSDEADTQCADNPSVLNLDDLGLMIGCAVSILILLLAVIWVGIMCQKRHRLRQRRHHLRNAAATSPWQPPVDGESPESQPPREYSRWLAGTISNHLLPWMFREPPPAYTESAPDDDANQEYEAPPPYTADVENHSLIPPGSESNRQIDQDRQISLSLALNANIIANLGVTSGLDNHDNPPPYDETNAIANGGEFVHTYANRRLEGGEETDETQHQPVEASSGPPTPSQEEIVDCDDKPNEESVPKEGTEEADDEKIQNELNQINQINNPDQHD